MFRALIPPIFRNARLCVTACGIMHPRCCRYAGSLEADEVRFQATGIPATLWVHYTTSCNTQSSVPEDGRDQRPKHVELIVIINKPLLLHLVGVYIIYINDARQISKPWHSLPLATVVRPFNGTKHNSKQHSPQTLSSSRNGPPLTEPAEESTCLHDRATGPSPVRLIHSTHSYITLD